MMTISTSPRPIRSREIGPLMLFDSDPEGVVGIIGFITFIAFGVWVLGVSIALFTEQELSGE